MRLNQYISHHSRYSRREADALIKAGRITIGRRVVENLSTQVEDGAKVFIDGKLLREKQENDFTVIVYHKPKGELVTKKDDRGRRTIYDTLSSGFRHFIPVGRLDFASEGLLLLTDSPKVAKLLMESSLERIYHIKIDGRVTPAMLKAMEEGIALQDARAGGHEKSPIFGMDFSPFSGYQIIKEGLSYSKIKVAITEGKNRELRRFFAHFGANVLDLKRVSYGWISLNALPDTKNRYLNRTEYKQLHEFMRAIKEKEKEEKPEKKVRKKRQKTTK